MQSEIRNFVPEELTAIEDASATHVEEVYGEHSIFIVEAEHVGIIAFGGSDTLLVLKLLDGGDEVAIFGGELELLVLGGCDHAGVQRFREFRLLALQKEADVVDGFGVTRIGDHAFDTRSETTSDVVLQTGARMVTAQVDVA